jgi:hypothetical protein
LHCRRSAWAGDDPTWIRLQATADSDTALFTAEFLDQERRALGEHDFKREYLGIPGGGQASPFTWELSAKKKIAAPLDRRRKQRNESDMTSTRQPKTTVAALSVI